MVAEIAARHSLIARQLDEISRDAMSAAPPADSRSQYENLQCGNTEQPREEMLWEALLTAPEEGWEVGELINMTGMSRSPLYRYLRELVSGGRAYQVSRGRWRARPAEGSPR
jgi:S-DNA-T family DNA segregation ATPase FtsK/SpoIIIE